MQLLHVVDKSEKFLDEMLHTDIRLKCAAVNDPAVDFGALVVAVAHSRLEAATRALQLTRCAAACVLCGSV